MAKVGRFLDQFIAYLGYMGAAMGVAGIVIMTLMITLNVSLRYFFSKPFVFVEEVSGYLLVLIAFMGFAYVMRVEAHINVELIVRWLPRRVREGLEVVTSFVSLVVIGVYFWFAWGFFLESVRIGTRAYTILSTSLWVPQTFLWVGLVFFSLELAARTVKKFIAFQKGWERSGRGGILNTG